MLDRRSLLLLGLCAAPIAAATPAMAAGHGGGEKKDESPFMELPTLTATVVRPGGQRGSITVQCTLYATDPKQRAKAGLSAPRVMDAYATALQAWSHGLGPRAMPNLDTLTQALQKPTDRLFGPGVRVLLGGVMVY